MRTCEIRVGRGRNTRWIRAYTDLKHGTLCIDCARTLHQNLRSYPCGDQTEDCCPVYETDKKLMFKLGDERCQGIGLPHGVLCDRRDEQRRVLEAQFSFPFGRRRS